MKGSDLYVFDQILQYHLRKMEGRRLDFDYKKRRKGRISNQELKLALEKFEESKELAERSMFNHLENDVRQTLQSSDVRSLKFLYVAKMLYILRL